MLKPLEFTWEIYMDFSNWRTSWCPILTILDPGLILMILYWSKTYSKVQKIKIFFQISTAPTKTTRMKIWKIWSFRRFSEWPNQNPRDSTNQRLFVSLARLSSRRLKLIFFGRWFQVNLPTHLNVLYLRTIICFQQ